MVFMKTKRNGDRAFLTWHWLALFVWLALLSIIFFIVIRPLGLTLIAIAKSEARDEYIFAKGGVSFCSCVDCDVVLFLAYS
jgi:hypothetical protein